jgi:hypothetical protein
MSDFIQPGTVPMQWDMPALDKQRWQEELWRIAPPSSCLSWLLLHWEPGDPWQPVHRWIVMQMIPRKAINNLVLAELEGPNPRDFGSYDSTKGRFVRHKQTLISRQQWELYRKWNCLAVPFWIIQGENGGHKKKFSKTEERIIAMATGRSPNEVSPPAPGDLCYAEPDERLIEKLGQMDRLRAYKLAVSFADRHPDQLDSEETAEAIEMRRHLWNWLESQVDNGIQEQSEFTWKRAVDDIFDNARPVESSEDVGRELEQFEERFITEGV